MQDKNCFKPSIETYVSDLWLQGKECYSDLNNDEKSCLTGLIMKDCSDTEIIEYMIEHENSVDVAHDLAMYLVSFDVNLTPDVTPDWRESHKNARDKFLSAIRKTVTQYAENTIDRIFNDKAEEAGEISEPDYDAIADEQWHENRSASIW